MTTAQYQLGCLTLRKRAKGADMWQWRWWEFDETGKRVQRSKLIGSVLEYPTAKAAQPAIDALRLEVNRELPKAVPVTVGTLIKRYLDDPVEMSRLAYSTKQSYTTHLNNWVKLKWGSFTLGQVRPMAVERWLLELTLAPRSKVHIRNLMHVLFKCAQRWELIQNNPISLVRQGGHRRKDPDILTAREFQALRRELSAEGVRRLGLTDEQYQEREFTHARARMMTILAVCLGLTRSEFTALKWSDFDWENAVLTIQRGIVNNHVGNPKTFARRKPVPLAKEVVSALKEWRRKTAYAAESDWVFASEYQNGESPVWPDSILAKIVQPAAKRAQIVKRVGWHAMRHTYSCLLRANGTDIKVQQELMRHSTVEMTLDTYTQANNPQKIAANALAVGQLMAEGIAAST